MKKHKNIKTFVNILTEGRDGRMSGGFISIIGGNTTRLLTSTNPNQCTNSNVCGGTNNNICTNSGDCSKGTNSSAICHNTGTCFA